MTPPSDDAMRRAEKIIPKIINIFHEAMCSREDGIKLIAAEIRAAVFESKDGTDMQNAYTLGKLSAFEEAAKICNENGAVHRSEGQTTWAALAESYAELIHTKAKEIK